MSPNFCLQRNLSALSVRSINHVLCPPPTSSIITSPSLSTFFLILTLSLHFLHFFCNSIYIFGNFLGTIHFFVHHQLPASSLLPLSLFLLVLSLFCIFITFWGVTHIHRPPPTSSNITSLYLSCFFLILTLSLHFLYFFCISRKKQHQKDA